MLIGGERARIGLIGESVSSKSIVQFGMLRDRAATPDYDGSSFGAKLTIHGSRADEYASFVSYSYDDTLDRLLVFLDNPDATRRPRLEQLGNSDLTEADALLERRVSLGADFLFGEKIAGLALAQYRDLVSASNTNVATLDFSWPLSQRWAATVSAGAGASDSEARGATYLVGGRVVLTPTFSLP